MPNIIEASPKRQSEPMAFVWLLAAGMAGSIGGFAITHLTGLRFGVAFWM